MAQSTATVTADTDFSDYPSLRRELNGGKGLPHAVWLQLKRQGRAGVMEAQLLLGMRIYYGKCSSSWRRCKRWLRAAAKNGSAEAFYWLSYTTEWRQNCMTHTHQTKQQRGWLRWAAHLGFAQAQRDIACYHWHGCQGFQRSEVKARYWYRLAALGGHQDAQLAVGSMMLRGDGGERDVLEALKFLEAAAQGPDSQDAWHAAREVWWLYEDGDEVEPDAEKVKYFKSIERRAKAAIDSGESRRNRESVG